MNSIDWRLATPQYDQVIDPNLSLFQYSDCTFSDLQLRLNASLKRFCELKEAAPLMVVNGADTVYERRNLANALQSHTDSKVGYSESIEIDEIVGSYVVDGSECHTRTGLLESYDGGYLILSANSVLINPKLLVAIRALISGESVKRINTGKQNLDNQQAFKSSVRVIIVGDRNQLGDLDYLDPSYSSSLTLFAEIETDIRITQSSSIQYLGYVASLVRQKWITRSFSTSNHPLFNCWRSYM